MVWRRIHVPEHYSFWDLHVAIQDAMGWQDCHLHVPGTRRWRQVGARPALRQRCNPKHPDHKEMREWFAGLFNPEAFETVSG
ncbi:MAG: hypothetical protein A3H29_03900 [Acidobacteria bacterium RIFCSPLOWO2_02_FULL_67_21]|nr:MAG: hypothetical protein A3H29_03900 [Acidobacteria bacterium RIFCSPLOWO2_02_FULL_67_21]